MQDGGEVELLPFSHVSGRRGLQQPPPAPLRSIEASRRVGQAPRPDGAPACGSLCASLGTPPRVLTAQPAPAPLPRVRHARRASGSCPQLMGGCGEHPVACLCGCCQCGRRAEPARHVCGAHDGEHGRLPAAQTEAQQRRGALRCLSAPCGRCCDSSSCACRRRGRSVCALGRRRRAEREQR